uniref:Secreted protein n=1 Tax=Ixodes scapularis TaxID=6945 RepID=A0A4D5RW48_IXOSC
MTSWRHVAGWLLFCVCVVSIGSHCNETLGYLVVCWARLALVNNLSPEVKVSYSMPDGVLWMRLVRIVRGLPSAARRPIDSFLFFFMFVCACVCVSL